MSNVNQTYTYKVEPSIGLARVGDSVTDFYLAPETIGGQPIQCDQHGNVIRSNDRPVLVDRYKDDLMRVKRQGARSGDALRRRRGPERRVEVTLNDADITSIEWKVHVANKKAAWYSFSELLGNLYYGGAYDPSNSYTARTSSSATRRDRRRRAKKAHHRSGARTISGKQQQVEFSRDTIPTGYPGSFRPTTVAGLSDQHARSAVTDSAGRLVVIGAYGAPAATSRSRATAAPTPGTTTSRRSVTAR